MVCYENNHTARVKSNKMLRNLVKFPHCATLLNTISNQKRLVFINSFVIIVFLSLKQTQNAEKYLNYTFPDPYIEYAHHLACPISKQITSYAIDLIQMDFQP